MRIIPCDTGTLHFVGIGGIGMSGIAEILHGMGYSVQGSDQSENANVQRLRDKGIHVSIGHAEENLQTPKGDMAAVVVVSSAVKSTNPELVAARDARLPVVRRADMLAELMRLRRAIAIGGTHGKTTTTSMVGAMLESGGLDPTVINGGIVNAYGTNTRMGVGDWMVAEADESDGTFTRLPATHVVVTNIDPEHMDHYGDFDAVRESYRQYVQNIPFYGFAVLCLDHPEVRDLAESVTDRKIITYGFADDADVRAENVRVENGVSVFDVVFEDGLVLRDMHLPMLGLHNVQNSLAALAIGHRLNFSEAAMREALANFAGVKRRFTRTGVVDGITVIDDYGHHPIEITAVLKAARMAVSETGGRVLAVMQPHRYSRLSSLFDEFCTCFADADYVFIAPVYAAGEAPINGVDHQILAEGVEQSGHHRVAVLAGPEGLPVAINAVAKPGDYVVCLGAGDITKWAYALPGQIENLRGQTKKSGSVA